MGREQLHFFSVHNDASEYLCYIWKYWVYFVIVNYDRYQSEQIETEINENSQQFVNEIPCFLYLDMGGLQIRDY